MRVRGIHPVTGGVVEVRGHLEQAVNGGGVLVERVERDVGEREAAPHQGVADVVVRVDDAAARDDVGLACRLEQALRGGVEEPGGR